MSTTVYMVRHAESPFVFGEERTRGLSEKGEKDAEKVMGLLKHEHIDVMVSSPYTRVINTLNKLANSKGLSIKLYEELKERHIKGLDYKLHEDELLNGIRKSFEDKEFCFSGGESTRQAQERSIAVLKQILKQYEGKVIVIGTHGNIMTIMMNYFDDKYGYEFWKNTSKPDIYKLVISEDKLIAVTRLWN